MQGRHPLISNIGFAVARLRFETKLRRKIKTSATDFAKGLWFFRENGIFRIVRTGKA